jgi:hypothetical protein
MTGAPHVMFAVLVVSCAAYRLVGILPRAYGLVYFTGTECWRRRQTRCLSICGTRKSHACMTQPCAPRRVNWTGQIIYPSNQKQENKVGLRSAPTATTVSRLFSEAVSILLLYSIEWENTVVWMWMRNMLAILLRPRDVSGFSSCSTTIPWFDTINLQIVHTAEPQLTNIMCSLKCVCKLNLFSFQKICR